MRKLPFYFNETNTICELRQYKVFVGIEDSSVVGINR